MSKTSTFHTFIPDQPLSLQDDLSFYDFCNDMGMLYGRIKRRLFRDGVSSKKPVPAFKNDYLREFNITARQFNSIAFDLKGNVKSAKESLNLHIENVEYSITSIKKWIKNKLAVVRKVKKDPNLTDMEKADRIRNIKLAIHNKKRKLYKFNQKLTHLKGDEKKDRVRLCFGGKKLFHKQFNLIDNSYVLHDEWLYDWRSARSSSFMFLGSKDEVAGNQTCKLSCNDDGTFTIRLRVPDCLQKYGTYVSISGIRYGYGEELIKDALRLSSNRMYKTNSKGKRVSVIDGATVTHRFVRKEKGWYLHTSIEMPEPIRKTLEPREIGCIGVDINEKEIAVGETDRYGNPVWFKTYPALVRDKTTEQTKAIYGDICKAVIERSLKTGKPIGHEAIDFIIKRYTLKESGVRYSRMLSNLAYSTFFSMLDRAAYRKGAGIYTVNPAFTSVIGRFNYMGRCGISPHESAALVIARRTQRYSESPLPARNAYPLPVRNRGKHVWSFWKGLKDSRACHHKLYLWRSLQDSTASPEPTGLSSMTPAADSGGKAYGVIPGQLCDTGGLCESG